jgi:RecA/RadA recombinase
MERFAVSDIDEYDALGSPAPKPPVKAKPKTPTKAKAKPTTKAATQKPVEPGSTPEGTAPTAEEPKLKLPALVDKPPKRLIANLADDRVLTKKGKESLRERWSAKNGAKSRDQMMQGLLDVARNKFGAERVFGTRNELEQLVVGIPTPSLAFEYLLANDIFPLGSLMMLAGSWGSCKSALSYEFFRWFHELNGLAIHVDTEDKFDAQFACDIMRVPRGSMPIVSNRANSVEQMQQIVTHYLKEVQIMLQGLKDNPGPKKSMPVCFCVDSLAGATSEEIQEKVLKAGSANRTHPLNALKNSIYLPAIKKQLENWPFTFLVINHLKEKTDDMGNTHQYTLGGQTFNFHESFELRTSIWKTRFQNSKFEGVGVRISCAKNSFGPTGRRIKTRFLWWVREDPETGEPQDVFLWDWNWALCTLLHEMDGILKQRLLDRDLRIQCKSPAADLECLANFRAIGMGKDEYLPFQEVGQLIQENEEVCGRIRDALNIKRRYWLDCDYDEIVKAHLERAT